MNVIDKTQTVWVNLIHKPIGATAAAICVPFSSFVGIGPNGRIESTTHKTHIFRMKECILNVHHAKQ